MENYDESFKLIGKLKVSRKIVSLDDVDQLEKLELHGFSDASLQIYGTCMYLKLIFKSGTISVNLVNSKSRLAPIKGSTIPRLELLGNLLLSRLMDSVKKSLSKVFEYLSSFPLDRLSGYNCLDKARKQGISNFCRKSSRGDKKINRLQRLVLL